MKIAAIKCLLSIVYISIPIFMQSQIIINVAPGNSIQAAINMASKGDTILVAPGNYTGNLSVIGKSIVIGSHYLTTGDTSFISTTIIEGSSGNTISFRDNSKTLLTGFTITKNSSASFLRRNIYIYEASPIIQKNIIKNGRAAGTNNSGPYGYPNQWGGGIFIEKGAPIIIENLLQNNSARTRGGGISTRNATPLIVGNTITQNGADENGGGIFCFESNAILKRNIIDGNTTGWQVGGAGILCENSCDIIENNTIVNNVTNLSCCQSSGGGIHSVNSLLKIRNNIIFKNTANSTGGISCSGPNFPIVEFNNVDSNFSVISGTYVNYSCVYDTASSISTDPLFVDFDNGDYRLTTNSPCIDMGNPNPVFNDQEDPSAQGMALSPAWGSIINDMGAFGGTGYNLDFDRDGLTDEDEINLTPPSNPSCSDTDEDGVLDGEEIAVYGTSPTDDDSDNDNFKDGFEIEMCTDPMDSSSFPEVEKDMDYDKLKQEARLMTQQTYDSLAYVSVQELDPPIKPGIQTLGMVFQEGLAIDVPVNFLDTMLTYCFSRPRAGLDRTKVRIYTDKEGDGSFTLRGYSEVQADYSSPVICPPIDTSLLSIAGKFLVKLLIGHQHPIMTSDFPQMFDFGGTGYVRFSEYDGLFGASYRVGTRKVFDSTEDFPEFREFYYHIINSSRSILLGKVDAEGFTAAVEYTLIPGFTTDMKVRATFFPRIQLASEELGVVGYSSMFWKDQDSTITISNDEAHDSDWLVVGFDQNDDGIIDQIVEHKILNPDEATQLITTNFGGTVNGKQIYFALENRDREESNYSEYADAEYHLRSSYSIQILKSNVPLTLKLYEKHTASEFNDNIAMEVVVQDMLTPLDSVEVEYITRAYNPIDSDGDNLTDQLERLIGTCMDEEDTDDDSTTDYVELLNGTNPRANVISLSDELMANTFVCETIVDTFFFSSTSNCFPHLPTFAIELDSGNLFSIIDTIGNFFECPYLLAEGGSIGIVVEFSATAPNIYSDILTVAFIDTIFQIPLSVTVERLPVAIDVLPDVCENNDDFPLSGGTPVGGNYSGIGVDLNNIFSPLEAGTGTFEITYTYISPSTGCSDFAITTISVNPAPTAEIDGSIEFCDGDSTILTASGGTSYEWSTGDNTASITTSTPDDYTVTVTDDNGCTDTENVLVISNQLPTAEIDGSIEFCDGDSTILTASGGTSYEWSTGDNTASITTSTPDDYTVTVTDDNGCSDTKNVLVISNQLPTAEIDGSIEFCDGDSTILTASGGTSYEWSTGDNTTSITTSTPDDYTVTVTDDNGCSDTENITIIVNDLPSVELNLEKDSFCIDETIIKLIGGTPIGGDYSGSGIIGNIFDPSTAGAGIHLITYTYEDTNGCVNSDSQEVIVKDCMTRARTIEINESVKVYPNPSSGNFLISLENWTGRINIQVFDIQGRIIHTDNKKSLRFEIKNMPIGIYLLRVSNDKYIAIKKLIVQ